MENPDTVVENIDMSVVQTDIPDFVLVYKLEENSKAADNQDKRDIFEQNLVEEGLRVIREKHGDKIFVLLRTTKEVLLRYCEILKFRMPIKKSFIQDVNIEPSSFWENLKVGYRKVTDTIMRSDRTNLIRNSKELTADFSRDRIYLFDVDDPNFFTQLIRIRVVAFILERMRFNHDSNAVFDFGIEKLISEEVYECGFPLHDGKVKERGTKRNLLHTRWMQLKSCFLSQPLNIAKEYFGVKIALYFVWLGFYNAMLIPASLIGLICFLYGVTTANKNAFSNDICNRNLNITMCPQCDYSCDYWKLNDSCFQAKLTYIFDNESTVAFAIFMSIWASIYLELWKRFSASTTYRWGVHGYDTHTEYPRPAYLAKLAKSKNRKINLVTNLEEPSMSVWARLPSILFSYSVVTVAIIITCVGVISVILYRMSLVTTRSFLGAPEEKKYKSLLVAVSAALINLIFITIMDILYGKTAIYLTEQETLRTQTEFDDSLTLKMYLFKFVNYYSSIFYLAFFKGKMIGYPYKYNRIFGLRQEECGPGGCFLGLFIQIAIIMVLKNFVATVIQEIILFVKRQRYNKVFISKVENEEKDVFETSYSNRWLEDYKLLPIPPRGLFDEYLEMILQYGFVTIFVAACPLAPFWALISNIFEFRLDAAKYLNAYRRPIPKRSSTIGVWYKIMDVLGRISVVTNAFIIAFTSNFIPRLVYVMTVSDDKSEKGFLEHSLAYFDIRDFQNGVPQYSSFSNVEICRYLDYRNPPWDERKYKRPEIYWHVLAARFAFIVVFQNIVNILRMSVQWAIPDMPRKLKDQIKREAYLTSEIIIKEEAAKSRRPFSRISNLNY